MSGTCADNGNRDQWCYRGGQAMSDDRWERAREDHIRWRHQDWDREDSRRRTEENRLQARRAYREGNLAWAAHKMGMTDAAIRIASGEFTGTPEPRVDPVPGKLKRAEAYLDQGQASLAGMELKVLVEQNHPSPRLHFLYGVSLFRQKNYSEAAEAFRIAERLGAPKAVSTWYGARSLMEVEAFDAAERWIGTALGQAETDPELEAKLNILVGECSMAREEPASAASAFQRAVKLHPHDASALAWLGTALVQAQRATDALAAFRQAHALGFDSPRMSYWWALAHVDTGDLISAERHLDEAVAGRPEWAPAIAMRGHVRSRRGHWAKAADDYSSCIELNPKRMSYYINRGICHLERQHCVEALKDFSTAEQLGPKSPRPPYYRATCLLESGRVREAQEAIAHCLELGPGYEPAIRLRERCWKP